MTHTKDKGLLHCACSEMCSFRQIAPATGKSRKMGENLLLNYVRNLFSLSKNLVAMNIAKGGATTTLLTQSSH
jgi:hypothetical protein